MARLFKSNMTVKAVNDLKVTSRGWSKDCVNGERISVTLEPEDGSTGSLRLSFTIEETLYLIESFNRLIERNRKPS